MPAAPASDAAIRASLLFAVGQGCEKHDAGAHAAGDEDAEVRQLLRGQGSEEAADVVLASISAGRLAVGSDSSLTISAQRYDAVRRDFLEAHDLQGVKGRTVWPVSSTTILKRAGGSWSEALRQAGLAASVQQTSAKFGASKFSEDDFVAALREFQAQAAQAGTSTSYQNYVSWRKEQASESRSDLPSGPSVRNTYGSWKAALESTAPERKDG